MADVREDDARAQREPVVLTGHCGGGRRAGGGGPFRAWEGRGPLVWVRPRGLFVSLAGWFIERFLPKRAIGAPSLTLAEHGFSFRSKHTRHRLGLGDPVDVVVARADLERRQIELGLRT